MKIAMEIIDCRTKCFSLKIILILLYFRILLSGVVFWFRHLPVKTLMYFVYQEMQTEKKKVGTEKKGSRKE